MTKVTYAELKELRDNGKLIPGGKYRMIDYETTVINGCFYRYYEDYQYKQDTVQAESAGYPFDLILTALDEKTLDEKCSAIWSERDVDGYFANSNLPAWDIRYKLDTYDYFWSGTNDKLIYIFDTYTQYYAVGIFDGTIVIEGDTYFKWRIPSMSDSVYTTYACTQIDKKENIILNENDWYGIYYIDANGETGRGSGGRIINIDEGTGKGVIYRLIDENNNSCPYDFKNIKFFNDEYQTFMFTFTTSDDLLDLSVIATTVKNNYIADNVPNTFYVQLHQLPANWFIATYRNSIEFSNEYTMYNNVINQCSTLNVIKDGNNNKIYEYCLHNIIDGVDNILYKNCEYNNLIDSADVILNYNCSHNEIKGLNILFGESCSNNKILSANTYVKNKSNSITFKDNCKDNIVTSVSNCNFGNNCSNNTLKTNATINNNDYSTIYLIKNINIGDDCSEITINSSETNVYKINRKIVSYTNEDIYNAIQATKS